MEEKDLAHKQKKSFIFSLEGHLSLIGLIIVMIAISMPFIILNYINYEITNLKTVDDGEIGIIGDFFGGTTVGLLTLASLIFVATAMIMQKKELELQRNEVTATRLEYEITNRTMKKQSFDSTFFNMINIHQSILEQINYKEKRGREAIQLLYEDLKNNYIKEIDKTLWITHFFSNVDKEGEKVTEILDNLYKNYSNITIENKATSIMKEQLNRYNFVENINEMKEILVILNNQDLLNWNNYSFDKEYNSFKNQPDLHVKKKYYESFYAKNEYNIGHYFRNLYRIVKYIEEYNFTENPVDNIKERKNYRGILRAQLSSYELLMLFYNICYSEKGEKFKDILIGTDFFDNHLIQDKFIWTNDVNKVGQFETK